MSLYKMRALLTVAALVLTAAAVQAGDVFLGITMSPITPSMARALQLEEDQGVLVDEVVTDSPAEAAGLEAGDVIVAIEGRSIAGSKGLGKAIRGHEPGDEITITVVRAGERRDLKATLAEREKHGITVWSDDGETRMWSWSPSSDDTFTFSQQGKVFRFSGPDGEKKIIFEGFGADRGYLGIVPAEIGRGKGKEMGLDHDRGVLVAQVLEDGPAAEAGLRDGDVIVALDGQPIDDGSELHDFLDDTEAGQRVTVRVIRDGDQRDIEVELAESPGALKLADIYAPGQRSQPMFYSGTIAPQAELQELEKERREVEQMKNELEALKQELKELREQLEKKQD
jgi:serine protease Do